MNSLHLLLIVSTIVINTGIIQCERKLKSFSWDSCGPDDLLVVDYVSFEPDPIHIPGNITINQQMTLLERIDSPTKVSFLYQHRPVGSDEWIDFPCIENLGSCDYEDMCETLNEVRPPEDPCPEILAVNNVPCRCPYEPGTYTITNGILFFPEPSGLDDGDYHLHTVITKDDKTACYNLYLTINTD